MYILSAAINTNTVFIQNTAATGTNYGLEIKAGTNSTDHALQVLNSSGGSLLRVRGDGNVGIGTTSPLGSSKLHVSSANGTAYTSNAQLRVSSAITNNNRAAIMFSDDATSDGKISYYPHTTAASRFFSISARLTESDFIIKGNGNVGIGTVTPDQALDVEHGNIRIKSDNDGNNGIIMLYDSAGTQAGQVYPSAGDLRLYSPNDIIMSPTGNVGIGTTSPGAKLDVVGPSNGSPILKLQRNGTGAYQYFVTDIGSGAQQLFCDAQQADSGFVFRTRNSSNATITSLYLAPSGNVGIGTTTPQSKLDIVQPDSSASTLGQSATASLGIRIANAIGQVGQIVFNNDAAPSYGYGSIGMIMTSGSGVGLGDMIFSTKSTGVDNTSTERMRITSDGSVLFSSIVGINMTTTPTEKLDVNGNIKVHGDLMLQSGSSIVLTDQPTANTGGGTIVNWSVSDTVTAGLLYVLKTNGAWTTTDADVEARSTGMLAIALASNAINGMLLQGFLYKASHGFTIGLPLYISNTAGAFTTTRPTGTNDYVRIIGYATSANYIYFDPDKTWVQVA